MMPSLPVDRRGVPCSVDVACFALEGRRLVRLTRLVTGGATRRAAELPWASLRQDQRLASATMSLLEEALGGNAGWLMQLGAYDSPGHPSNLPLSVAFVAVARSGTTVPEGFAWVPANEADGLHARQAELATDALKFLRSRTAIDSIPFRLLPSQFTLAELQQAYEVLLRRRLHKASFRRALQTANLIAETEEYRSAGRGRPARLYRYAPRRSSGRRPSLPFQPVA